MAGRIRSIKPEWLEDEALLSAGVHARVLSVALLLLSDDYGRGRYIPAVMAAQVFPNERDPRESLESFREAFERLEKMGFVALYEVRGQRYYEVCNWSRHQKVDKKGKPHVPEPLEGSRILSTGSRESRETLGPDLRPTTYDLEDKQACMQSRAREAERLTVEHVAQEWHAALNAEDGCPGLLHGVPSWRDEYEQIMGGIGCAVPDATQHVVAARAVCRWFWLAPDGPVQAGRVKASHANPGHLAKRISTDLAAASTWWAEQRGSEQEAAQ